RQRVVGLAAEQFVEQADRLAGILQREAPDVPMRAHQALPLTEFSGVLAVRTLDLGRQDARCDGAYNAVGDLILNRENVFYCTVVSLGPQMTSCARLNQLSGDAEAIAGFSDAAFEDVTHAELAADLFDIDGVALVGEAGVSSD